MWKKLVTTARFALCQHFTICSQQPKKNTDFTADSTKRNQNTREDLDVLTKRWTILQHTDCWNRNAGSGVSKCGSRQCTSWRHLTRHVTTLFGERLKNAVSSHVTSASWRGYTRHRKGHSQRTEKSTCLSWRSERKGDFLSSFTLRHGAPNATERWCGALAKIKRHGDTIWWLWIWLPHNLACCWRRVPVLYFAGAAPKSDVRLHSEYWECRIENPPGQDDNSEQPKCKQKKRSRNNNIKVEILSAGESAKYLDKRITFQQPEKAEIKNRTRAAWTSFYRYTQELTSRSYFLQHRLRLFNTVITPMLSYALTLGHYQRNMKEWYDRLNARCFASSSKQRENTKRKLSPAGTRKMTKTENKPQKLRWRNCRRYQFKHRLRPRQPHFLHEWHRWRYWHKRNWRYMKWSTAVAVEWMTAAKIPCWIETHKEEWNGAWQWDLHRYQMNDAAKKAATWNHGLSTKIKTCRSVGRL